MALRQRDPIERKRDDCPCQVLRIAGAVTCLEMYKKPYVKGNTYSGTYLAPIENHLIPCFEKMNLDDIRPYHIQKYINDAAEKYSPETIKKDYTVLMLIFQTAFDNQLCSSNPIVKSIPLVDSDLLEKLKALPHDIMVGDERIKTEYVFHSPEGKPYQPNNWVNRVYRPFMEKVRARYPDIPKLSAHELRHTRATLWIAQGIDPYLLARLLGHSDLKMLTKIYDHTSPETLRKAMEHTCDCK